jgi:hypothetical protein
MADENTEVIRRFNTEDWELLYANPLVRLVNLTYDMPGVCFSVMNMALIEDVHVEPFLIEDVHVEPFMEFLKKPVEEMPLYINDDFLWKKVLCVWRLKVAK